MRVGIVQSCYIPWRGYFDLINSVDVFVIYDDVQYSTGSWRNRNQLKMRNGLRWITVPVQAKLGLAVDEVRIGQPQKPWREEHRRLLIEALEPAPFFGDAMRLWEDGVRQPDEFISQVNVRLTNIICEYLQIKTRMVMSREYASVGTKTARLIELLKQLDASTYLSGPSAADYLEEALFLENRIGLDYKSYEYSPYPQLWGPFVGTVSVLDLIANCGPDAVEHLKATKPDRQVVPAYAELHRT